MTSRPAAQEQPEPSLPEELVCQLQAQGIPERGEVELRRALERRAPGYTLVRLTSAAARKWKARYRIMLAATYLDCQSAAEAYARALLAVTGPNNPTVSYQHSDEPATDV